MMIRTKNEKAIFIATAFIILSMMVLLSGLALKNIFVVSVIYCIGAHNIYAFLTGQRIHFCGFMKGTGPDAPKAHRMAGLMIGFFCVAGALYMCVQASFDTI